MSRVRTVIVGVALGVALVAVGVCSATTPVTHEKGFCQVEPSDVQGGLEVIYYPPGHIGVQPGVRVPCDTEPSVPCQEDQPCWEWETMGNRSRGTCTDGVQIIETADRRTYLGGDCK